MQAKHVINKRQALKSYIFQFEKNISCLGESTPKKTKAK